MSGELDPRKDLHSAKFKQRPQILVKLSFSVMHDSELSGLNTSDNRAISMR